MKKLIVGIILALVVLTTVVSAEGPKQKKCPPAEEIMAFYRAYVERIDELLHERAKLKDDFGPFISMRLQTSMNLGYIEDHPNCTKK